MLKIAGIILLSIALPGVLALATHHFSLFQSVVHVDTHENSYVVDDSIGPCHKWQPVRAYLQLFLCVVLMFVGLICTFCGVHGLGDNWRVGVFLIFIGIVSTSLDVKLTYHTLDSYWNCYSVSQQLTITAREG